MFGRIFFNYWFRDVMCYCKFSDYFLFFFGEFLLELDVRLLNIDSD